MIRVLQLKYQILVFCPAEYGGIADYAIEQAKALGSLGHRVLILAPPSVTCESSGYEHWNLSSLGPKLRRISRQLRFLRYFFTAATILLQHKDLNRAIAASGSQFVLLATYSEYLAPLWAWRLRRWRRQGVRFAAVVHDPVRDFMVGPRWWHRFSIAQGYSFLDVAFLHAPIQLDTGSPQPQLHTQLIPHGPFRYPAPLTSASELRKELAIPPEATLLLSFGHIRNNKNLQLILKAMVELPQIWLLVAGPEATAGQRPASFYRQLAEQLGVNGRCQWQIGYQSPEQVADLFTAADAVLLSYGSQFRSASGVMNLAAHYRKPVIASAGASALLDAVGSFGLGVVVQPDNPDALVRGIRRFLSEPPAPDWQAYERANSWQRNAELVAQALCLDTAAQTTGG